MGLICGLFPVDLDASHVHHEFEQIDSQHVLVWQGMITGTLTLLGPAPQVN